MKINKNVNYRKEYLMEKLKEIYENAEIELVTLKFSDVITTSDPVVDDDRPNIGDLDDWSKC
jgi:hypothetical protein